MAGKDGWLDNLERWKGVRIGIAFCAGFFRVVDPRTAKMLNTAMDMLPGGDRFGVGEG